MFFLRDLPDGKILRQFAAQYPEMDPTAVNACLQLLRTGSDLLTGFETMLGRHNLSQGRFLTLIVMFRTPDEPVSPSQLAEKVGVTRATMTGLLDGLEREKLIERQVHYKDRRMLSVRLTREGRQVLENMLPDYYRRIASLMKSLSEADRRMLIDLLGQVNSGLSALTT